MLDSTYLPAWRSLAGIAVKRRDLNGEKWILERELQIDPHDAKAAERLGKVLDAMMPKADTRP